MPAIHRNTDARSCGATTSVIGQSSVFSNGLLVSVNGDTNSHGAGGLIAGCDNVFVEGKLVVNHTPDSAAADNLCPPLGETIVLHLHQLDHQTCLWLTDMWSWLVLSIAGSIIGSATDSWFRDTKMGIWFYAKVDSIYTWANKRYGLKILRDEEKQMAKFPILQSKLANLERRLKDLEQDGGAY